MSEQQSGPILDGLGVTLDLSDGDLIASAMVIAKVVTKDGEVTLLLADSEGMSWLDQLGLVTAATDLIRSPYASRAEDED